MVQFDPPLSCAVSVTVPPTLLPGSRLCLHATLSRDEHASLRRDGTKVQVWSDFGTGNWSETSFEEESVAGDVQDDSGLAVDISLVGDSVGSDGKDRASGSDTILLVAATPLLPLVGRTVQFTYRLVHASGSVSWLGSMGTNGSIYVEMTQEAGLRAEDWCEDAHGVFSWQSPPSGGEPVVVAKLGQDADWRGWAIGKEGPSSFTALSSAVTERVALALLPKTRPGAYVVYERILYHTTGHATLSLTDSGEILFQPGDGESALHASLSTQSWRDAVSDKATTLDIRSPHFLGISVAQNFSGGRIYLLPISGSTAPITLTSSDLIPFTSHSASTLALVDSAFRTAKFIRAFSPDDVRVAVGPAGGEMIILLGFVLRNKDDEWNIACLPHGAGRHPASLAVDVENAIHLEKSSSSTEYATSESAATENLFDSNDVAKTSPARHPSTAIEAQVLLVMLYMLRFFLGLIATTISPPSSLRPSEESVGDSPPMDSQMDDIKNEVVPGPQTKPSLLFEVTGKFSVVVKGEVSKLALSVGGKRLDSNPEIIGEGVWLVESDTDNGAKLLEVTLHE